MGWAIGVGEGGRDIGYGVPAVCDYPSCNVKIDRGMSHCCGEYTTEDGCGLYFCGMHLIVTASANDVFSPQLCDACALYWRLRQIDDEVAWKIAPEGYRPKPDVLKWVLWKLKHYSWHKWRVDNKEQVQAMKARVAGANPKKIKVLMAELIEDGINETEPQYG